jgi:hypothetical protein
MLPSEARAWLGLWDDWPRCRCGPVAPGGLVSDRGHQAVPPVQLLLQDEPAGFALASGVRA